MNKVELNYSKTRVDKAGAALKSPNLSELELHENLLVLSNWRAYHAGPLCDFAKVLKTRAKQVSNDENPLVAQRLKRTSSILLKLHTHKTMRLSAMQDLGGLRAILSDVNEVTALLEKYRTARTKHELFSIDNYIDRPKYDGYRGIHLIYKLKKSPAIFIEIQIRSQLQHIWATGVEVIGTLQGSSFKSGQGEDKWFEFFSLLSSIFAIKESTPLPEKHSKEKEAKLISKVKKMIRDLNVIEQLSAYTSLYKRDLNLPSTGRQGNYSLIVLDSKSNTISVKTYSASRIDLAEQAYVEYEQKYFDDDQKNVVLVNSGDIKKLEVGYPNYFMDTKKLVNCLSNIMLDEYLKKR